MFPTGGPFGMQCRGERCSIDSLRIDAHGCTEADNYTGNAFSVGDAVRVVSHTLFNGERDVYPTGYISAILANAGGEFVYSVIIENNDYAKQIVAERELASAEQ
jgi:hypothetical protein